jgi:ankyrin repeat protein
VLPKTIVEVVETGRSFFLFCLSETPRKRAAKPVTTLVPHRIPQLAELLEAARCCDDVVALRRFLAAGGRPDNLVKLDFIGAPSMLGPLIFRAIATHHVAEDPALHHACLKLLLQAGANPNAVCVDAHGDEMTALMAACSAPCCMAPARLLLAHNADNCLRTANGSSALHSAARAGSVEMCELLITAGSGSLLHVRDCHGCTPLTQAVKSGSVAVVELVHVQHGCDVMTREPNGATLLHVAAAAGVPPVLEYLIRSGLDVNAVTDHAVTPVSVAVYRNNIAAVQTLLEHGASTALADDCGDSLLVHAVKLGNANIVEVILRHSEQPAVDVNARIATGDTALHLAVANNHTEVAAVLLRSGAAVNAQNTDRVTPLLAAVMLASVQCIQLLLNAGAELTAASTAVLHIAAMNSAHPEVLQLLLEQDGAAAMINNLSVQCNCCGLRTALMACKQPAHLKLLLAAGADVHVTTETGNTALHVAAVHKFAAPVMCLLIKAGVDLHAVNSDGKTAAQLAADSGNTLAAALLTRAARDS